MISKIKERLPDILIFFILLIIGIKISFGSENFTDIWYYDESMYLTKGVNFDPFARAYRDGYFYFLWYKCISLFSADNIELYFLNNTILLFLPELLLYLFLRILKINILISFLGSLVLLLSSVNIFVVPFVTKFVLLIILTGLIVLCKIKKPEHKIIFSIFFSLVLMYTRPEYILSFFILFMIYIIYLMRNFSKENIFEIIKKAVLMLSLLVLIYRFNPVTQGRANLAFTQHYVKDINNRNGADVFGLTNNDNIMNEHFGENASMFSALKNNPTLFTEHMWNNFVRLKDNIVQIIPYKIVEKNLSKLILISQIFFLIAVLFTIYSLIRRIYKKEIGLFGLIYFIFALPTLISIILYYPRAHYLIVIITMWLVYFCFELSNVLTSLKIKKINYTMAAITTGILLIFIVPFRSHAASIHQSGCTNLNTLRFLINLKLQDTVNFFNVGSGMQTYLGKNWNYKSAELINDTFENFVNDNQVNLIIVEKSVFHHRNIKSESDVQSIQANPDFTRIDIPGCSTYVLVKKNMLNE